MRHRQGDSRQQSTLFPESLDEYVSSDNPVRVIDAFIDTLDMAELGFTLAITKDTGANLIILQIVKAVRLRLS